MSDNCDHNFGTFDDFGVKNDPKVSNNMILMSNIRENMVEKRVKKFGQGSPPPISDNAQKKTFFFFVRASLT